MSENKTILVNADGRIVMPGQYVTKQEIDGLERHLYFRQLEAQNETFFKVNTYYTNDNGDEIGQVIDIPREWQTFTSSDPEVMLGQIADWYAAMKSWKRRAETAEQAIEDGKAAFIDILSGDVEAEQTVQDFESVIQALGWEMEQECSVEIQVTWRGTVTLPYGTEVEDMDIDDFDIREPEHREYESNFGYDGIYDWSIRERY